MKSVLIRIKQYLPRASVAEQGVLNYILSNPNDAIQHNIHQLSSISYSSASTIVRLCRKLGFEGYRDLQNSLLCELIIRKQEKQESGQLEPEDQLTEIINKITYRNMTSLENTMHLVDADAVKKSVDSICNSDTVLLFGIGASYLVAHDAYLKFLRLDKPCYCSEDIHSQYLYARNAKPLDTAIVISYSGYTEEIIHCAKLLHNHKTPIIAITRFDNSPLAQLATYCLYVANVEDLFRSGAMSSRISQLNMIDILYTSYLNRNFDTNSHLLESNGMQKNKTLQEQE